MASKTFSEKTNLIHQGRPQAIPNMGLRTINQPIYRCSTLAYDSFDQLADWQERRKTKADVGYGIGGTDACHTFEDLVAQLENGYGAVASGSGLAALTIPLLAMTKAGDHVLLADSTYQPTRLFADQVLSKFGIEVQYYDPLLGSEIEKLIKPNTSLIHLESPGSVTFEVQDVPAIAKVAQKHGVTTLIDNTWAGGLCFKPLDHGIDISIPVSYTHLTLPTTSRV